MRRATAAAAAVAMLSLAGCGDATGAGSNALDSRELHESAGPGGSPTASGEPTTKAGISEKVIEVDIEDGHVHPTGKRVEVGVGQRVVFDIRSDQPGKLHVHSTPEQELEFGEGESEVAVTLDKPGVVDVELHELGVVVVQLEVS
jgi:hypothetical protein